MLMHTSGEACFEHFVFLTVNDETRKSNHSRPEMLLSRMVLQPVTTRYKNVGQAEKTISSTTSLLTATTLIYAIGAGITAAAGTRLALQLVLVKGFGLYSFQLPDVRNVQYCYFLSLPPRVGIG